MPTRRSVQPTESAEPSAPIAAGRTSADWERVEADYRAGIKSLREIATEHGITEGAIRKRAKRDEWTRDLAAKVRAKADELVRKESVRTEVRTETASERQTVEVEAQVQARIRLSHRSDVSRSRGVVMQLMAELEAQTNGLDLFERLGEIMANPDENGQDRLNEAYRKVLSLGGRTSTIKSLAEALKNLIALERQAFGLDDKTDDKQLADVPTAVTALMTAIAGANAPRLPFAAPKKAEAQ